MFDQNNPRPDESFNPNPNLNQNPNPAPGPQSTEYRFTREDLPRQQPYMDANFVPKGQEPPPRTYYTPPTPPPPPQRKKKQKKQPGLAGFIAACLVCAILGGLGGGALVAAVMPQTRQSAGSGTGGQLTISDGRDKTSPTPTRNPGEALTGAEIYSLGQLQAVGVTTEITYTNYFGIQSTSPVTGSGFIVTEDGYIVTNYHVIAQAQKSKLAVSVFLNNGEKYEARIVGFEEANDLAVLKIEAKGLSAATLGNSDNLAVGEEIFAIGNPLGELSFSLFSGRVSALNRDISTKDETTGLVTTNNMFQIDAAVNQGNSGGPVYNDRGEVVGIVTAKYMNVGVEGLGFAIPINDVASLVDQLINQGYISGRPSFGFNLTTVDSAVAQYYNMVEGAYVYSIQPGSAAEKAGLKVGDIITEFNGKEITSSNSVASEKKRYAPGDTVNLKIFRQGEYMEVGVVLDEEKPVQEAIQNLNPFQQGETNRNTN